jgi:hypothetical protein
MQIDFPSPALGIEANPQSGTAARSTASPAHLDILGSSNQVRHLWLPLSLKPMNEFLLLPIGMGHPLVLTQMF